jgi:hypothetical protein
MEFVRRVAGSALALLGLTLLGWVWFVAETTGQGLRLGIVAFGVSIPAMAPIILALALLVVGLSAGFGHRQYPNLIHHRQNRGTDAADSQCTTNSRY